MFATRPSSITTPSRCPASRTSLSSPHSFSFQKFPSRTQKHWGCTPLFYTRSRSKMNSSKPDALTSEDSPATRHSSLATASLRCANWAAFSGIYALLRCIFRYFLYDCASYVPRFLRHAHSCAENTGGGGYPPE